MEALKHQDIIEIGQLLFGRDRWQTPLADSLGVSGRHIHYISKEERPPAQNDSMRQSLSSLLEAKLTEMEKAVAVAASPAEEWTPEMLAMACTAMFGDRTWQASTMHTFDLSRSRMTRLKKGILPVTRDLAAAVRQELQARRKTAWLLLRRVGCVSK